MRKLVLFVFVEAFSFALASASLTPKIDLCAMKGEIPLSGEYQKSWCLVPRRVMYNDAVNFCARIGMEIYDKDSTAEASSALVSNVLRALDNNTVSFAYVRGKSGKSCQTVNGAGVFKRRNCNINARFFCQFNDPSKFSYCDADICPAGVTHLACNNNNQFWANCSSPTEYILSPATIQRILTKFNDKRNLIATGTAITGVFAARMAKMKWNTELARLSSLNVKKCRSIPDACVRSPTFNYAGQLIAFWSTSDAEETVIDNFINDWYDKGTSYASQSVISSYVEPPSSLSNNPKGFLTMAVDRNTEIGCALSTWIAPWMPSVRTKLFTCHFASDNVVGWPVFKTSSTPGSGCTLGTDTQYPGLCKDTEPINPNSNSN